MNENGNDNMNIGVDADNGTNAFSFGDGSFITNEAAEPNVDVSTDTEDVTYLSDSSDFSEGGERVDVSAGATSFGDGSFETYEKSEVGAYTEREGTKKSTAKDSTGALGVASWILFLMGFPLCFISLIAMIISVVIGGGVGAPAIGVMAVIPVASVIFGIVAKIKHGVGLKNIIGGILCIFFMGLMFIASLSELPSYDDEYGDEDMLGQEFVDAVEAELSIDIPDGYYSDYYYDYEDENGAFRACDLYYNEDAYFDLIDAVTASGKYKTKMPSTYIGILPRGERSEDYDFCLVYNATTGEYNEIPEKEGTYRMICIAVHTNYDGASGAVTVTEYELEYTTEFKVESGFESDF